MNIQTAEFIRSAPTRREFLRDDRPQVAFVGRSNVGKSSLMNRLLGRKGLARTSSTPGRTRAVNYFLINDKFYFTDLPGYGYAKASHTERDRWAATIDDYFRSVGERCLVVLLVDSKVGATPLDVQAAEYMQSLGVHFLVVATKIDRLSRSRRPAAVKAVRETLELPDDVPVLGASAKSSDGLKELWQHIRNHL